MLRTALGESTASLDSTTRSDLCTHYCLGVMPSLSPIYWQGCFYLIAAHRA